VADPPVVGVLGAGGAVGRALVGLLSAQRTGRLRLGLRRPTTLPASPGAATGPAEVVAVDAGRPGEVEAFARGCDVVVDCVGPVAGDRSTVPLAVLAAGCDYLDPGGDEALRARLSATALERGRRAVVGAGVLPGLSELLGRWLLDPRHGGPDPARPRRLVGYVGTRDRMTPASAAEFLLALRADGGRGGAIWRAGARTGAAAEPVEHEDLPFFGAACSSYAYLTAEMERLARADGLDELRWHQVFAAGSRTLVTLSRLQRELQLGGQLQHQAEELVHSVALDMFGHEPSQQLALEVEGFSAEGPVSRSLLLRAGSTYEVTAAVATLTVDALRRCPPPPGAHLAADLLDPGVVPGLAGLPGVHALEVFDEPLRAAAALEQGVL
jgi:hypothetical protein